MNPIVSVEGDLKEFLLTHPEYRHKASPVHLNGVEAVDAFLVWLGDKKGVVFAPKRARKTRTTVENMGTSKKRAK